MATDVQAPNSGWEEIDPDEKINLLAPESNGTSAVKEVINSPEDVLLKHLEISIVESEKRMNGPLAIKEYYSVYLIETKAIDRKWIIPLAPTGSVWRRYSEFELLRMQMEENYPDTVIPPLPEKKATYTRQTQSSDNIDPIFVDRRRVGLESFLVRVASHPILCRDKVLIKFLQSERDWSDIDLNAEGGKYVHQAEVKLKNMNALLRVKKVDDSLEQHRQYSMELQTGLGNLLRTRVRLADRLYAIHKLHSNYGRVFSEWSALEKAMGDGLQKAGHYMDCYSASIDAILEEEDIVADQLKEYYYFSQAVQALCNRHQMAQYQVEKAESHLALQKTSKENYDGNDPNVLSKLWGKWTGASETLEEKQAKIRTMDQNIDEAQVQLEATKNRLGEFTQRAKSEVERFQKQKDDDLKESLANYVMLQLKMCKMGLQTWKHIKEALQEVP